MLFDKLIAKQNELGLSNAEFARLLGISRTGWIHIRNDGRPVGRAAAVGAMRAFPDLAGDVLSFLVSPVPIRIRRGKKRTTEEIEVEAVAG